MDEQDEEGSNKYIITHLRYMCEVVLKKIKKYEHLLEGNDNSKGTEQGKKIVDLIALIEKNCQAFKQSWKNFYQVNFKDLELHNGENEETRNPESSKDFHRPLSQISMYKSLDDAQNIIKQEWEETDAILNNKVEENSETNNSNSSNSKCLNQIYPKKNPDVHSEDEFEEEMSPILGRKEIVKQKKNNTSYSNQKGEVLKDKHETHVERKVSEEYSTDQLLQQLNDVIDSPSPVFLTSSKVKPSKKVSDTIEKQGSLNFLSSPLSLRFSDDECGNENHEQEENEPFNENDVNVSSLSIPLTSSAIRLNKNVKNKSSEKNILNKCNDDTPSRVHLTSSMSENILSSPVPQSSSTVECDNEKNKKAEENEPSIEKHVENNVGAFSPRSSTASIIRSNKNGKIKSTGENNILKNCDTRIKAPTGSAFKSTQKIKPTAESKVFKQREINTSLSPIPLKTSEKINIGRHKSIKDKNISFKRNMIVSSSPVSSTSVITNNEQNELSVNNAPASTPSRSPLVKSKYEQDEMDFGNIAEERKKLIDSQETVICDQEFIGAENDNAEVLEDESNVGLSELYPANLFEQIWQEDTRDCLMNLLPSLSQSLLNDESAAKSCLDNTDVHNCTEEDNQIPLIPPQKNTDNLELRPIKSKPILNEIDSPDCEDPPLLSQYQPSSHSLSDKNNTKSNIENTHNYNTEDDSYNLILSQDNTRDGLLHLLPPLSQPILSERRSSSDGTSIRVYTEQEVQDALNELESSSDYRPLSPWSTSSLCNDSDDQDSIENKSLPENTSEESLENDDSLLTNTDADDSEVEDAHSMALSSSMSDLSIPIDFDLDDFYKVEYNIRECRVVIQKHETVEHQMKIYGKELVKNQYNSDEGVEMSEGDEKNCSWGSPCTDFLLDGEGDCLSVSKSEESMEDDESISSIVYSDNLEIQDIDFLADALTIRNSACNRKLEKYKQDAEDKGEKDEDDEIDRLCRMDSLKRRQNPQNSDEEIERKRMKENDIPSEDTVLHEMPTYLEDRTENYDIHHELGTIEGDEHLAVIVSSTINDNDISYASDAESTREINRKNNPGLQNTETKMKNGINDNNKHEKDHWTRDPLLTCKITVDENDDKENQDKILVNDLRIGDDIHYKKMNENQSEKKKMSGDEISSADENLNPKMDKENEGTNGNINEEHQIQTPNEKQIMQPPDQSCQSANSKRRKNIRPVLTYEELTEATKRAEKEEEQRSFRIEQKQQFLSSQSTEEDELILDTTKDGEKIKVDTLLCEKLYPHQRKGVMFMWQSCYESVERLQMFKGLGCILAHCMGLGKTFQVFTLLHTLFAHPITNMKHCLIICPLSTIIPWVKEIQSGLRLSREKIDIIVEYIDARDNIINKCLKIRRWKEHSGILLIGYEAFVNLIFGKSVCNQIKDELYSFLLDPGPDLVVCDEGHLLKNGKSQRTLAVSKIKTRRRIILSGTPMQNNLNEYYFMVNFVNPNLLGTFKEYSNRFVLPITNGQYGDSTQRDIMLMKKRSHVLHKLLRNTVQRFEVSELNKYLKPIKNFTIFIQMHPVQASLYKYFIKQAKQHFTFSITKSTNLFGDMNVAKYICSHPHLLSIMEEQLKKNRKDLLLDGEENVLDVDCIKKDWWKTICSEAETHNIECGPKMKLTLAIIEEAEKLCEKVLIFTSSLIELKSLEYFLKKVGTCHCKSWCHKKDYFRMDGSVQSTKRANICTLFNNPENKQLRLLLVSYKVGGLGLTLTAANRVIILGSVFNPVHDTQSIYRCYRFGQTKTVYVYRLISMGTMEEKIYRRCVSKLALACRVVDKQQIDRHYVLSDIEQLYVDDINLNVPKPSLSKPDDDLLASLILKFDFLHKYVDHQGLLENKPEDDLNDEDKERAWEEFRRECENQDKLVQSKQPVPLFTTASNEILNNTAHNNLLSNVTVPMNAGSSHNTPNIHLQNIHKKGASTNHEADGSLSNKVIDFILPFARYGDRQSNHRIESLKANLKRQISGIKIVKAQNKSSVFQQGIDETQKTILNTSNNVSRTLGDLSMILPVTRTCHKNVEQASSSKMLRENEVASSLTENIQAELHNSLNTSDAARAKTAEKYGVIKKKPSIHQKNLKKEHALLPTVNKNNVNDPSDKQVPKSIQTKKGQSNSSTNKIFTSDFSDNAMKKKITSDVYKQIENLADITVNPVVYESTETNLNTEDRQKQTEPSSSEIISNKRDVGIAGRNVDNSISKNNDIYEAPVTSVASLNIKPDGVVQNAEKTAQLHRSENVIKQMHNMNKPQSQKFSKKCIKKGESSKYITKNKEQGLPQISVKNPMNIISMSERSNSHINSNEINSSINFDISQKRVYPFPSENRLQYDSHNSPLDLSTKVKHDESIKTAGHVKSNQQTRNRGESLQPDESSKVKNRKLGTTEIKTTMCQSDNSHIARSNPSTFHSTLSEVNQEPTSSREKRENNKIGMIGSCHVFKTGGKP